MSKHPGTQYQSGDELWTDIPDLLEDGFEDRAAQRDLCALECLANAPAYAKPDSEKVFLLWEARNISRVTVENQEIDGIRIE